jgi:hypothetical protein
MNNIVFYSLARCLQNDLCQIKTILKAGFYFEKYKNK